VGGSLQTVHVLVLGASRGMGTAAIQVGTESSASAAPNVSLQQCSLMLLGFDITIDTACTLARLCWWRAPVEV
jgi:hypothetical protein